MLDREAFYRQVVRIARRPSRERHILLSALHAEVLAQYLAIIRRITDQASCRISSDGRTIAQVVAHIAEWDRWTLVAVAEIVAGVRWPRIMSLSGYAESGKATRDFNSVDDFNAYQAERYVNQPWQSIQDLAIDMATSLHVMFTQPQLVSPERLDKTDGYEWHLPDSKTLAMPAGWYLWMVTLEHEGVEHIADLESVASA